MYVTIYAKGGPLVGDLKVLFFSFLMHFVASLAGFVTAIHLRSVELRKVLTIIALKWSLFANTVTYLFSLFEWYTLSLSVLFYMIVCVLCDCCNIAWTSRSLMLKWIKIKTFTYCVMVHMERCTPLTMKIPSVVGYSVQQVVDGSQCLTPIVNYWRDDC